jgi:membrane carboxypeptidase/penicillin-binding protein
VNNAAAAHLQAEIGSRPVLTLASDAGLQDLPDVPSLALGTGLVTPLDLTAAYTIFPGGGEFAAPRGMLEVLDAEGTPVFTNAIERRRIVSPEVAFQATSMLRDVVERGTGNVARALGVRGPIAGKTGTTDDYHDAWFVGFSTSVVVGVWIGFDQPAPIGQDAYAARIAVPIWADFMKRTAQILPAREFAVPSGLRAEEMCSVSYLKPVDGCPTYTEYFKDGDSIPSERCAIHEGSLKQRAARAVEGFFRSLGRGIAGMFGRR